uniref:Uncharacterized protein n=1 Tax=Anguilla anguilla TaxID=7936 RepID=A0A0E9W1D1_ANGAN
MYVPFLQFCLGNI